MHLSDWEPSTVIQKFLQQKGLCTNDPHRFPPKTVHPSKFSPRLDHWCSEKFKKMCMFMTAQSEKDWTSVAFIEGWLGKGSFSPKGILQHNLVLQNCIWTNHKSTGTIASGLMRLRWRCLVIMHRPNSISSQTPHASCQSHDLTLGLFCMRRTRAISRSRLVAPLMCCGERLKELCVKECPHSSVNWNNLVKNSGSMWWHQ